MGVDHVQCPLAHVEAHVPMEAGQSTIALRSQLSSETHRLLIRPSTARPKSATMSASWTSVGSRYPCRTWLMKKTAELFSKGTRPLKARLNRVRICSQYTGLITPN